MAASIDETKSAGPEQQASAGFWASAGARSLLIAVGFYAVFYGLLHPGYAILDDVKIISIAVGYPGVQPAPFLIFSNVLLGLALTPLYGLGTSLNWEIILFGLLNFISLWVILYMLLSSGASRVYKTGGAILILACAAYYGLNITFSGTAALASFAGLSAILASALAPASGRRRLAASGIALIFAGSLVRIQMLYLMAPLAASVLPFIFRLVRPKRLLVTAGLAALMVFGGYAFDRLYVRAHPEWNTYYFYNQIAQMVQDSHRLENMHLEIRRIGWTGNDQELFARSFFPDPGIYSVDHLRYLVDHVSGIGQDPLLYAVAVFARLANEAVVAFLLLFLATFMWAVASEAPIGTKIAIPLALGVFLCETFGLTWIYKDPQYVLLASLANTVILCILILAWRPGEGKAASGPRNLKGLPRIAMAMSGLVAITGLIASTILAIQTSNANLGRQREYAKILVDLARLEAGGQLPNDAVIISPAYGIPVDWSNPFILDFPQIPYLDTGWSTFSPPYEQALRNFGIASLPQALYEKPNLYLMSETIFQGFLERYYQEHGGTSVTFKTVYTLGYPDRYAGYHEVALYKVVKAP